MLRERDPKNVPIHIALGRHDGEEGIPAIDTLAAKAQSYLGRFPKGRVVWFEEAVDAKHSIASLFIKFRIMRDEGHLRSQVDGIIQTMFTNVHGRIPTTEELAQEKERLFHADKSFAMRIYKTIDSFPETYLKRLDLTVESAPPEEIAKRNEQEALAREARLKRTRLVHQGRFLEALPYFQEEVTPFAEETRARDNNITKTLRVEAETSDTLAVVGHVGAAHTGVYHELRYQRYNVIPFFPEKEDGTYVYNPASAALRALVFYPNRTYTQNQWLKTLIQEEIYKFLDKRRRLSNITGSGLIKKDHTPKELITAIILRVIIPTIPQTDQGVIKLVYAATRDLDEEKISAFQDAVKNKGFTEATVDLIKPYLP